MKSKPQRVIAGVFLAGMTFLAGCSSDSGPKADSAPTETPTVALILPNADTPRYEQQDKPKFEEALDSACSECKFIYYNSDNSVEKQRAQVDSAIAQGADVIVFAPVDINAAASMTDTAQDSGVKVIALGRGVVGDEPDAMITYDPIKVGVQQAETLIAEMEKRGLSDRQVVMINGAPTDDLAMGFKEGARQVLLDSDVKIGREYDTPDWSPTKAQTEMDQAITALGADNIGGVVAANDTTAGSVIAAMKNAGMDPMKIPITGLDADVAALQRILSGEQAMTVYQPVFAMHQVAVKMALSLARGDGVPQDVVNGDDAVPTHLFETLVVTAENMADTVLLEKENYIDVATLCAEPFAKVCADSGIE